MIYFNIGLSLPDEWAGKHPLSKLLTFYRYGSFSRLPHKHWEVQVSAFQWTSLFDLTLDGRDHAGVFFSVMLLGIYVGFNFYDSRHWNEDKKRFSLPDEEDWDTERVIDNALVKNPAFLRAREYLATRSYDMRRDPDSSVEFLRVLIDQIEIDEWRRNPRDEDEDEDDA